MSLRKKVFRPGDAVKIITPTFFVRCGYPLSKQSIIDDLTDEEKLRIEKFAESFNIHNWGDAKNQIADRVAYWILKGNGFGGENRSIHTVERPEFKDTIFYVSQKRRFVTGTYDYDSTMNNGVDIDCRFLAWQEHHTVLFIARPFPDYRHDDPHAIEAKYCEKVDVQ